MLPAWVAELVGGTPISLPGGAERTLFDVLSGFSLAFSLLLATWGGVGLAVSRRGETDPSLVYAVARVMAGGAVVLLVLSLLKWGIGPSIPLALLAVSFTLAAVRAPGQ